MQDPRRIAAGAMLLLGIALAQSARAQDDGHAATDDAQTVQTLLEAEATGRLLYRHDQAAARATDAVMELEAFRQDSKQGRLGGWISEARGDGIVVSFLSSEAIPRARYRVEVSGDGRVNGEVQALPEPATLTDRERAAAQARSTAAAATFEACSRSYNSVVLPAPRAPEGGWTVYLLPGTTQHGIVPIGGSYRFDLDASGTRLLRQRGFTRSCIVLDNPREAEALMVTHLLDPAPTEVHVFWSLWADKPLYVGTSAGTWSIEQGHVRLVERSKDIP